MLNSRNLLAVLFTLISCMLVNSQAEAAWHDTCKDCEGAVYIPQMGDPICKVVTCHPVKSGERYEDIAQAYGLSVSQILYFKVLDQEGVSPALLGTYPNLATGWTIRGQFPDWWHFTNAELGINSPERVQERARSGKNLQFGLRSKRSVRPAPRMAVLIPKEPNPCLDNLVDCTDAYLTANKVASAVKACKPGQLFNPATDKCMDAGTATTAAVAMDKTAADPTSTAGLMLAALNESHRRIEAAKKCKDEGGVYSFGGKEDLDDCVIEDDGTHGAVAATTGKRPWSGWQSIAIGLGILLLLAIGFGILQTRRNMGLSTREDRVVELSGNLTALRRQLGNTSKAANVMVRELARIARAVGLEFHPDNTGEAFELNVTALAAKVEMVVGERDAGVRTIRDLKAQHACELDEVHQVVHSTHRDCVTKSDHDAALETVRRAGDHSNCVSKADHTDCMTEADHKEALAALRGQMEEAYRQTLEVGDERNAELSGQLEAATDRATMLQADLNQLRQERVSELEAPSPADDRVTELETRVGELESQLSQQGLRLERQEFMEAQARRLQQVRDGLAHLKAHPNTKPTSTKGKKAYAAVGVALEVAEAMPVQQAAQA